MNSIIQTLTKHSLFSGLSPDEVETISQDITTVNLSKGEILFEQNDPSDAFYLLISGRLSSYLKSLTNEKQYIGDIRTDEAVGELGFIAEEPRTLTVIATRPSTLLKVPRDAFVKHQSIFINNPQILKVINNIIMTRSRKTLNLFGGKESDKNIILINADHGNLYNKFISNLQKYQPSPYKIRFIDTNCLISSCSSADELKGKIKILERQCDLIIYVFNTTHQHGDIIFDYADKIIVIGSGNTSPQLTPQAKKILASQSDLMAENKILVLLYECPPQPQYTHQWLELQYFQRYHHINIQEPDKIQQFWRFLTGNTTTLVLSGGGKKGWIHVGVIKALCEHNIPIDAVGGCSIGAIIGALFSQYTSFDEFYKNFCDIMHSVDKPYSLRNITWPIISVLSGKRGTLQLQKTFGELSIENLPKFYFAISCNINRKIQVIHTTGLLWQAIRASVSLPGLIPPILIDDEIHVDGGFINNIPVDIMKNFVNNQGTVIAVNLTPNSDRKQDYHFPPYINFWDALLYRLKINRRGYRFPGFYQTLFSSLLCASSEKISQNIRRADILIEPTNTSYSTLAEPENIDEMIELGYQMTVEKVINNPSRK